MDLAGFLEALPAAQLDSVYASQVRACMFPGPGKVQNRSYATCCCNGGGTLACWL